MLTLTPAFDPLNAFRIVHPMVVLCGLSVLREKSISSGRTALSVLIRFPDPWPETTENTGLTTTYPNLAQTTMYRYMVVELFS